MNEKRKNMHDTQSQTESLLEIIKGIDKQTIIMSLRIWQRRGNMSVAKLPIMVIMPKKNNYNHHLPYCTG
jgi:hypothetical protein